MLAVVLRLVGAVGGDQPDQPSLEAEHPEVVVERDLLATVARHVSLVGHSISTIGFEVALVRDQIALVGEPFTLVRSHLAEVGSAIAFVCFLVA